MNDEEFQRLTTLYLEDAIDADDVYLLNRELANSPERVRQFNEMRLVSGLISEFGREVKSGGEAIHETNASSQASNFSALAVGSRRKIASRPKWLAATVTIAALASVVSLLLVLCLPQNDSRKDTSSPALATLAYTSHARWSKPRVPGDDLGKGKLQLDVGLARLDFRNGATVTLQGPAEFEILSTARTILSSGILTASIPKSAVGFEVVTPSMDVVDLGTAFGVSVGKNGETDVCVFEGEVEVSLGDSADSPKLVREGNAVRSKPQADAIDSVVYSTERYEDAWPVTSGVLQATGLMKFVSPGPDFVPGKYEDSDHILVFLERSRVLLKSDLGVNVTEPGQYTRVRRRDKQPIAAGKMIRSYLLQFNPIGEFGRNEVEGARVIGQITFDRPILGLIGGTALLNKTDELLGHPLGNYLDNGRGIEPTRPEDSPDSGRDSVTLSSDRRSLSLDLSASSAVDQIRVVVSQR